MHHTLRQRLEADLKTAMRERDAATRDAIRFILAAVKNMEIERRGALTPQDEVTVLRRLEKQLTDAIAQYEAANRPELAAHEEAQLRVVQRYLPTALSDEELQALVSSVIAETDAKGPKDLGKVMPVLMQRAAGRAEGKRLSEAARAQLSGQG